MPGDWDDPPLVRAIRPTIVVSKFHGPARLVDIFAAALPHTDLGDAPHKCNRRLPTGGWQLAAATRRGVLLDRGLPLTSSTPVSKTPLRLWP